MLSSRIRTWLLFAFIMPFVGRLLEKVGMRSRAGRPGLAKALESTGQRMQSPRRGRRRRLL